MPSRRCNLLLQCAVVGALPLLVGAVIDRLGYGEWVCVQWNFLKFNILEGKSALYGVSGFHYYFTLVGSVTHVLGVHINLSSRSV